MTLRIAYYRKLRGLTQKQLAKKLHIHPDYLGALENERAPLAMHMIDDLERALKLTPQECNHMLGAAGPIRRTHTPTLALVPQQDDRSQACG